MTIRYTATAAELLRFNLRMLDERMSPRFLWRDGTIVIAIAAAGIAVLVLGHWPVLHRLAFGAAIAGLTLFFFPRVRRAGLKRRLTALAERHEAAGEVAEIEVTIDDLGVTSRAGGRSRRIEWRQLAEIERDAEWAVVVGRDGEVIPIPWRAVPSGERRAALETLLQRHEELEAERRRG